MQRGAIKDDQRLQEEENQRAIDDEHWVLDMPTSQKSVLVVARWMALSTE
jgi:hypothetical protein